MSRKLNSRVLVVDDDRGVTTVIGQALSRMGVQAVAVYDMETALDNFTEHDYDLVLVDIFMPGMGGIEGIRQIRKLQPDARIVAMSGGFSSTSPGKTLKAAEIAGANGVMPKPFSIKELQEIVSRHLATEAGS